jgi:hypothetical protein
MLNAYKLVLYSYILLCVLASLGGTLYHFGFNSLLYRLLFLFVILSLMLIVLLANIKLHWAANQLPRQINTVGVKATIISCLLFTPIEAVIVLPAINLIRLRNFL